MLASLRYGLEIAEPLPSWEVTTLEDTMNKKSQSLLSGLTLQAELTPGDAEKTHRNHRDTRYAAAASPDRVSASADAARRRQPSSFDLDEVGGLLGRVLGRS
jgi:hypothetical protein